MFGPRDIALSPLVVSVANANPFVSLADIKTFLGVSGSGDDALLTVMLDTACQNIELYCNTIFAQRTVTEQIWPEDPMMTLILGRSPVISLTSLTIDSAAQSNLSTDYYLSLAAGFLKRVDGAYIGGNNPALSRDGFNVLAGTTMQIVYVAGYATIPPAVVEATKEFVRDLYLAKDRVAGVKSESLTDVGSITYADSVEMSELGPGGIRVPLGVAALIGPFVRQLSS